MVDPTEFSLKAQMRKRTSASSLQRGHDPHQMGGALWPGMRSILASGGHCARER